MRPAQTVSLTVKPWELEGLSWSRASHLLANFFPVTSNNPRSLSLWAGFSGWSSSGDGKEGELATTSLELEYLHWKRWCKMLIGRDDINNDINTLNWHVFFNVSLHAFLLVSALHWLAEIWRLSKWGATLELEMEFKFHRSSCKLSFLFPSRNQSAPESLHSGYRSLCES